MSDKNNGDFFGFIQENWGKLIFLGGIIAGVVQVIPILQENPQLYIYVGLGVIAVIGLLACIFYTFYWKPEVKDGNSGLIIPGSDNLINSQGRKVKQRKKVRLIARLGLIVVPLLMAGGIGFTYYQAQLPPTDFRIVVADFESSDENHGVTEEIFSNLEREMEKYKDVKVERLGEPLESIQAAKEEGEDRKAAIVIWGSYRRLKDIFPIRVNFEILKSTSDYIDLGESVQGKTQPAEISELESFNFQTNLSQEMNYLSLFTLGMYRYLDEDWEEASNYFKRALKISSETNEPIASLGKEIVNFYLGSAHYFSKLYDESFKSFDKAIEIKPDLHEAWSNRGIALGKLGRLEEAIASFDKAID